MPKVGSKFRLTITQSSPTSIPLKYSTLHGRNVFSTSVVYKIDMPYHTLMNSHAGNINSHMSVEALAYSMTERKKKGKHGSNRYTRQ